MIYFLYQSYHPNTAIFNRALAYFKNIEELKRSITVVFFMPDAGGKRTKVQGNFKYVKFVYLWEHYRTSSRYIHLIYYFYYLIRFVRSLKQGDIVYIYSYDDILRFLLKKKGVKIVYEKTESPEVSLVGSTSKLFKPSLEEHINLVKRVDSLIVISQSLKDYYISKGIKESNIHIVNMTVDADRFLNVQKQIIKENYLAFCGKVSNTKDGIDILIRAFSIVVKTYPQLKLYIIGQAPQKNEECSNMVLIEELGIQENVVFTGLIPSNQIPQILKNAELLLLCRPDNKQAKYGFPTKLGEYLLTSNPVVVTTVGDIPLFLKDGESAYLCKPDSPTLFSDKILYALQHRDESDIIGKKGKEVALRNFNASNETEKLLKIIENLGN